MEKVKNNLTGTIIATIISLMTIVAIFGGFMSNQAKLEVELANIKAQLAEINTKLDSRDDKISDLTQRITVLETKEDDK